MTKKNNNKNKKEINSQINKWLGIKPSFNQHKHNFHKKGLTKQSDKINPTQNNPHQPYHHGPEL